MAIETRERSCAGELGCEANHEAAEGLVAVEAAVVGPDSLGSGARVWGDGGVGGNPRMAQRSGCHCRRRAKEGEWVYRGVLALTGRVGLMKSGRPEPDVIDSQLQTTLAYCKWHCMANAVIPNFNINSSGLRFIWHCYRSGNASNKSCIPGLKEFLYTKENVGVIYPAATREDEALGSEAAFGEFGDPARADEPFEHFQYEASESRLSPCQSTKAILREPNPAIGPTEQVERAEASRQVEEKSKRSGLLASTIISKGGWRNVGEALLFKVQDPSSSFIREITKSSLLKIKIIAWIHPPVEPIGVDTELESEDDIPLSRLRMRPPSEPSVTAEDASITPIIPTEAEVAPSVTIETGAATNTTVALTKN
uniref:Uncharacterized protein n=1 Tax=Asparagus officinalis TaxID=4686 RepID=Q2AAA8_ASPOF|nr:hypothetical protein 17.t00020 [Asparagus officinalis]